MSQFQDNSILAHSIHYLFLNQLPIQRSNPLLTEVGVAEEGVEILLREENVFLAVILVDTVILVGR